MKSKCSSWAEKGKYYNSPCKTFTGMHPCVGLPASRHKINSSIICTLDALYGEDNKSNATHCINWNKYYTNCRPGDKNPFQGAISFDNIGLAWVAIFLVISLEGWTDIMYYVQDAHSFWDWVYFVLLIVVSYLSFLPQI